MQKRRTGDRHARCKRVFKTFFTHRDRVLLVRISDMAIQSSPVPRLRMQGGNRLVESWVHLRVTNAAWWRIVARGGRDQAWSDVRAERGGGNTIYLGRTPTFLPPPQACRSLLTSSPSIRVVVSST
jgi:hypothetical protein